MKVLDEKASEYAKQKPLAAISKDLHMPIISKRFKTLLNLRDKVLKNMKPDSCNKNLSDGYIEMMAEDNGHEYTKSYLKGLL